MVFALKRIRGRAAIWDLSDGEVKDMMAARKKILEAAGMKRVAGHFKSFKGDHVFIVSYPSLEAMQKAREQTMSSLHLGHDKYFELEEEILYEVQDT